MDNVASGHKQFHVLTNIRKGIHYYIAGCSRCHIQGYYKDIRQQPCGGKP